jgi:hypothetical protein
MNTLVKKIKRIPNSSVMLCGTKPVNDLFQWLPGKGSKIWFPQMHGIPVPTFW